MVELTNDSNCPLIEKYGLDDILGGTGCIALKYGNKYQLYDYENDEEVDTYNSLGELFKDYMGGD